jgi:hypothetical protein
MTSRWADGPAAGWRLIGAALALSACPTIQPSALSAQTRDTAAQTIDTIVVRNGNIFDDRQVLYYGLVARLANSLHVRTRATVIRRTLLVEAGDPYDSARVAESERRLRRLRVFREVQVDTGRIDGRLALLAATADGWSTKPQLNFSTVGGDQTWEAGIVEENFLGLATTAVAIFRGTPDRRELELQYVSPQLLFRHANLVTQYLDRSDGHRFVWSYGIPFYHASARRALVTQGEAANMRVLRFRDGALDSSFTRRALRFDLTAGTALRATSRDYTRLWVSAVWRREDVGAEGATLPRSVFGAVGAGVDVGHVRFRVVRHLNSYARREDANLSRVVRLGVWAAPRAWGYPAAQAGLGPEVYGSFAAAWPNGFAALRLDGHGIYTAAGLDSGRVRAALTVVDQNLPRQTWALLVEGGALQRPRPGTEFDLWLERSGPRLFGVHAFTGTRMLWGMLENRILVSEEIGGLVGIGLAPFVEWGGAWYADEAARYGGDAGLSFRLGPTRAVRGDATEIAVGVRFGRGWTGRRWAVTLRRGFEL